MAGFHEGELAVQTRAGTASEARRLAGMLAPPDLNGGGRLVLAAQRFAAIAARDADGVLWASVLRGPAGFLDARDAVLDVAVRPYAGDPLADLRVGTPLGMVAIDFAHRRRVRVNGVVTVVSETGFRLEVDQAFGNCPKYIHPRAIDLAPNASTPVVREGLALTSGQHRLITAADTFFLGTVHPTRGVDASHRGGPQGFVHVDDDGSMWWPDYPGNNLFNSFGNLASDPSAALVFVDFDTGTTLHLAGVAQVEWDAPTETGRSARFVPHRIVENGR